MASQYPPVRADLAFAPQFRKLPRYCANPRLSQPNDGGTLMQTLAHFSPDQTSPYARSRFTSLDEVELAVGEQMELQRFPEERLYVFTDGRGLMDIYPGDQYEIRQTTALWTTPMIPTKIRNTGPRSLHFIVFRVGGVPVPQIRDGMLTWTAVAAAGQAAPGSGQSTTYIYESRRHEEGLHLRIHLIPLRRAQRTHDPAELLTLLPGGATQLHTHPDIEESIYVLCGTGTAWWDDEPIPLAPGSALCYPPGVARKITNTGDVPLTYVCHAAGVQGNREVGEIGEIGEIGEAGTRGKSANHS
jgi:mannose-6-phosphate isomerase-like protein (cupin superfamily)